MGFLCLHRLRPSVGIATNRIGNTIATGFEEKPDLGSDVVGLVRRCRPQIGDDNQLAFEK